jgi:DNA-binding transcriptional ArsR family regulator
MDRPDPLEPTRCASLFKALGDPERLRIIRCLRDGPKHVSDLAALLGSEVVKVSHHLGVLRHAALVIDDKQGRFVFYRLNPDVVPQLAEDGSLFLNLGCCRVELP